MGEIFRRDVDLVRRIDPRHARASNWKRELHRAVTALNAWQGKTLALLFQDGLKGGIVQKTRSRGTQTDLDHRRWRQVPEPLQKERSASLVLNSNTLELSIGTEG